MKSSAHVANVEYHMLVYVQQYMSASIYRDIKEWYLISLYGPWLTFDVNGEVSDAYVSMESYLAENVSSVQLFSDIPNDQLTHVISSDEETIIVIGDDC